MIAETCIYNIWATAQGLGNSGAAIDCSRCLVSLQAPGRFRTYRDLSDAACPWPFASFFWFSAGTWEKTVSSPSDVATLLAGRHKMPIRQAVLDLDETFICCRGTPLDVRMAMEEGLDIFFLGDGTPIIVRPGYYRFLNFMRKYFDNFYVFTAASDTYAQEVAEVIFAGRPPTNIWWRTSCRFVADGVIKPLQGKLSPDGKDLDNPDTIMIDDRPEVTSDNLFVRGENHFVVNKFLGSKTDTELKDLEIRIMKWIVGPKRIQ
jgi:hypothetical protein